jgi:ElaB/YqjD/DUF883 family membrane-anchored ribosome-binding protein
MARSTDFYLNWAKERANEMDAVMASLESKANEIASESRTRAEQLMGDLRTRRDAFQDQMKKQAAAGEAAWGETKSRMESEWNKFQVDVKKYIDDSGQRLKQQQATFQNVANAQLHAWREAVNSIQSASAELAADHRTKIEAAVQQMRTDASAAEANFRKLRQAGSESWAAWNSALAQSRASFDRANQTAWDAFKRAGSGR